MKGFATKLKLKIPHKSIKYHSFCNILPTFSLSCPHDRCNQSTAIGMKYLELPMIIQQQTSIDFAKLVKYIFDLYFFFLS